MNCRALTCCDCMAAIGNIVTSVSVAVRGQAISSRGRIAKGTTINADEAALWDDLATGSLVVE